ncbi:MAG: hypothetical protein PUD59_04580 [bacterium]|nr:hypothetical protein [bacterium]
MKNYKVYYLFIVFLIIMIFVPPLFRIIIPKEENNSSKNVYTFKIMDCNTVKSNNNNMLNILYQTIYRNDAIYSLKITYQNVNDSSLNDFNSEMLEFQQLKDIPIAQYNSSENSIFFNVASLDDSSKEVLSNYINDIDTQKNLYESKGFSCKIALNE